MSRCGVADKQTQTGKWEYLLNDHVKDLALIASLRDQVKNLQTKNDQFHRSNRLRDNTLRMLSDSETFQPEPRKQRVSVVDALKKQTALANKMTELLQPDVWEQQKKQQEEEQLLQKKRQEEEAEQKQVARLKQILEENDRLKHESRQKKSEWEERVLLRVLDSTPPAATKPVPVPPPTQSSAPSAPRGRMRLAPLRFSGKMEELKS
jgi:hypothetical protein